MWIIIALAILSSVFAGIIIYESTMAPQTIRKPAVYLYPITDSNIDVELKIKGELIKDIPEYGNGWNVFVTKEGLIENQYDYLFYEAKLKKIELPKSSWIVKYESLETWFDTNLVRLGLNEKEKTQFMEYWMNELPKSNYYEIKLIEQSFLKENMNLIIKPEPDTVIRLNFYFKPIKEARIIQEQIIETPERKGFVVVEWGGILDE